MIIRGAQIPVCHDLVSRAHPLHVVVGVVINVDSDIKLVIALGFDTGFVVSMRFLDMRIAREDSELILRRISELKGISRHEVVRRVVGHVRSQSRRGNRVYPKIVERASQVDSALLILIDGVNGESAVGYPDIGAVGFTEEADVRAAGGIHARNMHRAVLIHILDRVVPARCFRTASAAVKPRIAKKRECVGEILWIGQNELVELQRVLTADREGAELFGTHTTKKYAVKGLTATTAIGVCGLTPLWPGAVSDDARASVSQLAR